MNFDEGKKVFEVYLGTKNGGELVDKVIAGHAFLYEGDTHYVLKLMMIPNVVYFLGKNPESQITYTVFTKCIELPKRLKFQNPVGFARLTDDLKTHMEIELPLFRTKVYMSLFPKQFAKGA